jgi:hypothetical protein
MRRSEEALPAAFFLVDHSNVERLQTKRSGKDTGHTENIYAVAISTQVNLANYADLQLKETRKGKGKAVLLQAWSGPEGSRKLSFPDFMTMAKDGGKVVSLTHRPKGDTLPNKITTNLILRWGNNSFHFCFQGRSQNSVKRLSASSCLSVCQHGTTRFPLNGFP